MECKYHHTERIGLYFMVIVILLFGPCDILKYDHKNIIERLDRIEIQIGINGR